MSRWKQYVAFTKKRKPGAYLDKAFLLLGNRKGDALDLGSGAGVDARYLAENGFFVEAIDDDDESIASTRELCGGMSVSVRQQDINTFPFVKERFSLVICRYVLPFLNKEDGTRILENIQRSLVPGGIFIFGFIGPEDDWMKTGQAKTAFNVHELEKILNGMKIEVLDEVKEAGRTAIGKSKFWHKIEGIARKQGN